MILLTKKNKRLLFILLIPVLIALSLFLPFKKALVFEYQNTGILLAYLPLGRMDTFKMKYTHSIHLSIVVESYKITKNNQIKQYELMYEDFAIGMPANSEEGEVFEEKDGKYFIKNMKRSFPSFDLRVGKVKANHTLIYKYKEYPLSSSITPGTSVHVEVKKINLVQLMKGVDILES
ncbi:DUF1850 domain-containing protein [Pseudoneobacillus rhizosphaerae]|uniref:DUF1850 domain-containing protein n=1 Tax=Pseudoneobacillus rhizosphaerae TaxID=2880968 RepID=A0A9C7GE38_9BACI|nr:DUF1850 domain-containing protein [Pseudoneobacillus rhizosphaerae]CAG9610674.1 hypothetical protein NEOCIP111885_04449 [Pseudoneobacillus rhizosphaerae]